MAECFCGCGRKVGGLMNSRKSANGVGRTSREAASELEALRPALIERSEQIGRDPEGIIGMLDDHLRGCEAAEQICREVVHEERDFKSVDWSSVRTDVRNARGMNGYLRRKGNFG